MQQHIARMRFLCQFNIEGRVRQVNAQLIGEIMYCEEMLVSNYFQQYKLNQVFNIASKCILHTYLISSLKFLGSCEIFLIFPLF